MKLDVKSRKDLAFTGPADYPFPTAIVDTVSGWDQKSPKPSAIVLISQIMKGMVRGRRKHGAVVDSQKTVRRGA